MISKSNKIKEMKKRLLCKELGLDYSLIEGDVYDGGIILSYTNDPNIMIKFSRLGIRKVNGSFRCYVNNLISLKGCPEEVDGNFYCDHNKLTSLKGCPEKVGRNFWCDNNNLTSLEGCPEEVGGEFWCHDNKSKLERPKHCKIRGTYCNE